MDGPSSTMASDRRGDTCPLYGSREDQAAVTAGPALVILQKGSLPTEAVAPVGPAVRRAGCVRRSSPRRVADASMDYLDLGNVSFQRSLWSTRRSTPPARFVAILERMWILLAYGISRVSDMI